ncbi:MAG TPA: dihydropteroate synthase [Gammaproteobacteria bacterium]|nr:dihydropteroate synthase [Gammaproteobacteria bacterium]
MQLNFRGQVLDLSQPRVMGVLNRTPDSFSDGGAFADFDVALRHALEMVEQGADLLDIGGESTRPGAQAIGVQQELDRVIPLIERLAREVRVPISVDTSKPEVMRAAVAAGARMINDVYALRLPGALEAASECGVPVCIMHMQGEPRSMQWHPQYQDVFAEVNGFLQQRLQACIGAGIPAHQVVIDPGFGFGKNLEHNLTLLRALPGFKTLGQALLVGLSRKSMLGTLLGDVPPAQRLYGSVAAAVIAVLHGAQIVRCHDVGPTIEALKVAAAAVAKPRSIPC